MALRRRLRDMRGAGSEQAQIRQDVLRLAEALRRLV